MAATRSRIGSRVRNCNSKLSKSVLCRLHDRAFLNFIRLEHNTLLDASHTLTWVYYTALISFNPLIFCFCILAAFSRIFAQAFEALQKRVCDRAQAAAVGIF